MGGKVWSSEIVRNTVSLSRFQISSHCNVVLDFQECKLSISSMSSLKLNAWDYFHLIDERVKFPEKTVTAEWHLNRVKLWLLVPSILLRPCSMFFGDLGFNWSCCPDRIQPLFSFSPKLSRQSWKTQIVPESREIELLDIKVTSRTQFRPDRAGTRAEVFI